MLVIFAPTFVFSILPSLIVALSSVSRDLSPVIRHLSAAIRGTKSAAKALRPDRTPLSWTWHMEKSKSFSYVLDFATRDPLQPKKAKVIVRSMKKSKSFSYVLDFSWSAIKKLHALAQLSVPRAPSGSEEASSGARGSRETPSRSEVLQFASDSGGLVSERWKVAQIASHSAPGPRERAVARNLST